MKIMKTIDGHTFDETLLTGGWVIDAGCRGFNFLDLKNESKYNVFALDIEDFSNHLIIGVPLSEFGIKFKHAALSDQKGFTEAYLFGNGTANFIKGVNGVPGNSEDRPVKTEVIEMITLDDIYNEIGTDINLLKLDIEGAEYGVLYNVCGNPVPKQITVEFHEHTNKELHDKHIDELMECLSQYYHCNLYIREWPRYKYMDCLFIRKDLL